MYVTALSKCCANCYKLLVAVRGLLPVPAERSEGDGDLAPDTRGARAQAQLPASVGRDQRQPQQHGLTIIYLYLYIYIYIYMYIYISIPAGPPRCP